MTTIRPVLLLTAAIAMLLTGCGGGEQTAEQRTELAQEASDAERYCSLAAELDAQENAPTEEQLAEISNAAPPEIAGDVAVLVETVRSQDFEDNEAAAEAERNLIAWEEENCTTESMEVQPGEGTEATS